MSKLYHVILKLLLGEKTCLHNVFELNVGKQTEIILRFVHYTFERNI